MTKHTRGDVIWVKFQFSEDHGKTKQRPAVVLASGEYDDLIVCQVTSKNTPGSISIPLESNDFTERPLVIQSYVRPLKIMTVYGPDVRPASRLNNGAMKRIIAEIHAKIY